MRGDSQTVDRDERPAKKNPFKIANESVRQEDCTHLVIARQSWRTHCGFGRMPRYAKASVSRIFQIDVVRTVAYQLDKYKTNQEIFGR